MPKATGPGQAAPYLTLHAPLAKGVYAESADTAWEKYRDQLAALHQSTQREDLRQQMAWGAYQDLLRQAHDDMRRGLVPGALSKAAGEGARGGHVIGHTKSGKPVYGAGHEKYATVTYKRSDRQGYGEDTQAEQAKAAEPGFTHLEHGEAAKLHRKASNKHPAHSAERMQGITIARAHSSAYVRGLHLLKRSASGPATLSKAQGEGARGGRIVGHTKAGHPIYQSGHARYARMHVHDVGDIGADAKRLGGSFGKYGKADHAEAASAHFKQAYKADYGKKTPSDAGRQHLRAALAHNRLATTLGKSMAALVLKKGGPGSRGGHVIGTTRSGKPIYSDGSGAASYHGADHAEAAEAHGAAGFAAHLHGDQQGATHHRSMARTHLSAAQGPAAAPKAARVPLHHVLQHVFSQYAHAKSLDYSNMSFQREYAAFWRPQGGLVLDLNKGGEGSRGGHVIGHTKSGKPIYADGSQTAGFTKRDHSDAVWVHGNYFSAHEDDETPTLANERAKEKHMAALTDHHKGDEGAAHDYVLQNITGHTMGSKAPKKPKSARKAPAKEAPRELLTMANNRPVFANRPADHKVYANYNQYDHMAAALAHYRAGGSSETASAHVDAALRIDPNAELVGSWSSSPTEAQRRRYEKSLSPEAAMKSGTPLKSYFEKSGEGTRGGRVIGHTRSNKPVYAHQDGHQTYTPKDFHDASDLHMQEASRLLGVHANPATPSHGKAGLKEKIDNHVRISDNYRAHSGKAKKSDVAAGDLRKAGEGSRGGKVIGHTGSGKPIYQHGAGTGSYTPSDHLDARDAHTQAASKLGPKVGFKVAGAEKDPEKRQKILNRIYDHHDLATDHLNEHKAATGKTVFHPSEYTKTPRGSGAPNASIKKSSTPETDMTSTDLLKSYFAKGKFKSGNIEDAETVDGLDAKMTGANSNGSNGPGGFTDQEEEDKKVAKRKLKPGTKNGGPARSIESQAGVSAAQAGTETVLSEAGPYDIGGDVSTDIGRAPPTKVYDGGVYRSMEDGDLAKAGEGSRGGKIIGHTKSGKAVYGGAKASSARYHDFSGQDHADAVGLHYNRHQEMHNAAADLSNAGKDNHAEKKRDKASAHMDRAAEHGEASVRGFQSASAKKALPPGELEKAGEGSRGGKIVGHTKSGKAIYGADHAANAGILGRAGGRKSDNIIQSAIRAHGNYSAADHAEAGAAHDAMSKKTGDKHYQLAEAHNMASGFVRASAKKSMAQSDYAAGNGRVYRQQTEINGHVVHIRGGFDAYCADLAKGGGFWAHGDRYNPYDAEDQNSPRQVLCKSCDNSHSEMYSACPNCASGRGMQKSFGHAQDAQANLWAPLGPGLVDVSAFGLED